MDEVTIDVPAEHVGYIREVLLGELAAAADCIDVTDDADSVRAKVAEVAEAGAMLDSIGWTGDAPGTWTADQGLIERVLDKSLRWAATDVADKPREDHPKLVDHVEWTAGVLADLDPVEAVAV